MKRITLTENDEQQINNLRTDKTCYLRMRVN